MTDTTDRTRKANSANPAEVRADAGTTPITPMSDLSLGVQIVLVLFAPLAFVLWCLLFSFYLLWTAAGVILTTLTGRNWCLFIGELPRLKQ